MLQKVSLQMFKYSQNTLPEVIHELFITNDTFHSHNTRNKNKLRSKLSSREYIMYKNFSFIGVYIWNDIQDHILINTPYSKFKSNTKNYFQYNNIYNIYFVHLIKKYSFSNKYSIINTV